MSEENNTQETITEKAYLIADIGNSNTTVSLIDSAAGSYRLLASATVPTTVYEPWADVSQGLQQAIKHIMSRTGRKLMNSRGDIIRPTRHDGTGIDFFTAVFSAAPRLNTILVGLSDSVSLQAAKSVLQTNYINLIEQFNPADNRTEEEQLQAFAQAQPDIVFIAGGTDGGASSRLLELINTVDLGMKLSDSSKKPAILFAGNIELREQVSQIFGTDTTVHVAENINPTLTTEHLDGAISLLSELYNSVQIHSLTGMREIIDWAYYPFQPTAHAFANMIEYMAVLNKADVLGVDLGSHSLTIVTAKNNKVDISVRTDLGMGHPISNILTHSTAEAIIRWLPTSTSEEDAQDYVHNKSLYPHSIPQNEQSLFMEQAIARELIRCAMNESNATNRPALYRLIVARGATLANAPEINHAILTLLDAIEPAGIFSIAFDKNNILPALGQVAPHNPLVAVQCLENGILVNAGWVIAPSGKSTVGQKAVTVSVETENSEKLELTVDYGDINRLPLPPGQSAKVTIKPTRRLDIGFGPGKSKTVTMHGGLLGIIIDARGRPLNLVRKKVEQDQLIQQWLRALGE